MQPRVKGLQLDARTTEQRAVQRQALVLAALAAHVAAVHSAPEAIAQLVSITSCKELWSKQRAIQPEALVLAVSAAHILLYTLYAKCKAVVA